MDDAFLGDPDFRQFVDGFSAELSARRRAAQPPPRGRAVVGDDAAAPAPAGVTVRDLIDAVARVPHAPPTPQQPRQEFPWGAVVGLGIGVGLALGLSIALLAKSR